MVRGSYFPLGFLVNLLLARYLGITGLGVYSEALAWSSVIAIIGTAGLDRYAVREISAISARQSGAILRGLVRKLSLYALGFAAGVAVLALILFLFVRADGGGNETVTFAIAILMAPVMSLAILRQGMLQGLGRVVLSRLPEDFLRPGIFVLVMLLAYGLLAIDPTPENAMLMQASALIVAFLVGTWLLRRHLPRRMGRAQVGSLPASIVRSALPIGLFAMASVLMLQIGVITLGFVSGPDQVALYATAFKIAIAAGLAEFAVNNAYQPMAAAMIASGDTRRLSRLAPRAGAAVLLLSLPISIVIFIFSAQILSLFGSEFVVGESTLRILCVSYFASGLFGQNATLLMMSGNVGPLVKGTALALVLIVALNVILAPRYGAEGAAVAWLVTVVVWNLILGWWVWRKMGFSPIPFSLLTMKFANRT